MKFRNLYPQFENADETALSLEETYQNGLEIQIEKEKEDRENFIFTNREFLEEEDREKKFLEQLLMEC